MKTKADYTSVCNLHSFRGQTFEEALRKAADFFEKNLEECGDPTVTVEHTEDGEYIFSVTGSYRGNTDLSQMEAKK